MDERIIFLDIDGVMIPSYMVLISRTAFYERIFPPHAILILTKLCQNTNAKVVLNTTHNAAFDNVPEIKQALINHGLSDTHFHSEDPHTKFPQLSRSEAIVDWLSRHPEVGNNWVVIDDKECAEAPHMLQVDSAAGITLTELNAAVSVLGGKPVVVMF